MPIFGYNITSGKQATSPTFKYSEILFLIEDCEANGFGGAIEENDLNSQGRGEIEFILPSLEELLETKRDEYLDEFLNKTPKKVLINKLERQIKLMKRILKEKKPRQRYILYKCI